MQSIFRYPGGKSKSAIQKWILAHKPYGTKEYREPFVGGGGIFFGLNADAVEHRWINDKHTGLVEVYRALRDRPADFIQRCKAIAPPLPDDAQTQEGPRGGKPTNSRLKLVFESLCLNKDCDQALRYYFVNRTVHGSGRVNYDIPSRLYFSNPDGWNIVEGDTLQQAAAHIDGTQITDGDYSHLFTASGDDVWIYADPPYVVNGNLTPSSQLYQHGFGEADHRRFAEVVAACEHKVCVSYDDDTDGFVRSLFPADRFHIIEATWKYAGTTNEKKEDGKELLILNYEPPGSVSVAVPESMQLTAPLSDGERDQLEELELSIERHFKSFVDMGVALQAIRDSGKPSQRLYRETHQTFDEYCESRWGITKDYANKLIAGSIRYGQLKTNTKVSVLPERETHVRALCRIESHDEAAEVWGEVLEAVDSGEKLTARLIKEHVDAHLGIEPPPPPDPVELARKALSKLDPESLASLLAEFLSIQENAA